MTDDILDSIQPQAELNEEGLNELAQLTQWARWNAILSLLAMVCSFSTNLYTAVKFPEAPDAISSFITAILGALLSLLLNTTLLSATGKLKTSIAGYDQELFNMGLAKLTKYFKITGILTIIALVFITIAIISGLSAIATRQ